MIALNMLLGQRPEPYLEYALKSTAWLDEHIIINTGDDNNPNLAIVQSIIPNAIVYKFEGPMSFGRARQMALEKTESEWILWQDADEVHFNEFQEVCRKAEQEHYDSHKFQFYHFLFDLYHYQGVEPRTILFKKQNAQWTEDVHERVIGLNDTHWKGYTYHHYGYTKPQHLIYENWKLYWSLNPAEAYKINDGRDPNDIITDRVSVAHDYVGTYPEVMSDFLKEHKPLVKDYHFIEE